ncbi:MAG: DUF1150 family protein [Alphaproteobacteria bacterium]
MHTTHKADQITEAEFATLGLEHIAYVKPVVLDDGRVAFAICSADGQEITRVEDRDIAFATIQQNDLEPLSVH